MRELRRDERQQKSRRDELEASPTERAVRLAERLAQRGHAPDVIERTIASWMAARRLAPAEVHAIARLLRIGLPAVRAAASMVQASRRRVEDMQVGSGETLSPRAPWRDSGHFRRLTAMAGDTREALSNARSQHLEIESQLVALGEPVRLPYELDMRQAVAPSPGVYALQMSSASAGAASEARGRGISPATVLEALGPGRPLPLALRVELAPKLAANGIVVDLAAVRVHDTAEAADLCAELDAEAFAIGVHLVFAAGRFREDREGAALVAHELTHVWQQARGVVGAGVDDAHHHEAEAIAVEEEVRATAGQAPTSTAGVDAQSDEIQAKGEARSVRRGVLDPDPARAAETRRLLAQLGDQLAIDTGRYVVRADEGARAQTEEREVEGADGRQR